VQELFAERIPSMIMALGHRYPALFPELATRLSETPCTLSHGDYRLDNMFFTDSGGLAVYDWQLVDRSRGGRDLGYFLTQSLTRERRIELERSLIDRYVDRLAARGVEGYGFDIAWRDYRLAALLGFAYPVCTTGGLEHTTDRTAVLCAELLDRSIAAILDLECLQLVDL
jgi:hypothetical protein